MHSFHNLPKHECTVFTRIICENLNKFWGISRIIFLFWHPNPGPQIIGIANYFSTTFDLCTAIVISDSSDEEISEVATSQTSLMSFFRPRMAN